MANLRDQPVSSSRGRKTSRAKEREDDLPSSESELKQILFVQSGRQITDREMDLDLKRLAERDKAVAKLRAQLHGDGFVGAAFRKLVDQGCDEAWLEVRIVSSHLHPWKSSKNPIGKRELQELLVTANVLRRQAVKLGPLLPLLIGRTFLYDPSAAEALAVSPDTLRGLAKHLKLAHEKSKGRRTYERVASRTIPIVIEQVRESTGKPHFSELATLYGAAYERDVSAEELRTMESREKKRLRMSVTNSSGKR